jgi:hypothetical protein
MTFHWLDLSLGTAVGAILGTLATWKISPILQKWSDRRALNRDYQSLAGEYEDFSITSDGATEPTGETIELAWDSQQAKLEATAMLASGFSSWHSYISMSQQFKGTGTGHYNYANSIHGGIQQLVYSRQARAFHVLGISNTRKPFLHYWVQKHQKPG